MGAIQSDTMFHFLPSHCWIITGPLPSWSSQVTLTGCVKPLRPIWSSRASVMFTFSSPQRTCSPVSALLPNLAIAVPGRNHVSLARRPPVADEVIHLDSFARRLLHRHLVHHAPAGHVDPVRVDLAHLEPRRTLLL